MASEMSQQYGQPVARMYVIEFYAPAGAPAASTNNNYLGKTTPTGLESYVQGQQVQPYASKGEMKRTNDKYSGSRLDQEVQQMFNNYLSSKEGQDFVKYLNSKGKKIVDLKPAKAADLGDNAVAAAQHNGIEGRLLGNYSNGKNFKERISEVGKMYGIETKLAEEYVFTHELAHLAGYDSEEKAEGALEHYFQSQAFQNQGAERDKYVALAKIAGQRKKQSPDAQQYNPKQSYVPQQGNAKRAVA
jgi:hypothetical protein